MPRASAATAVYSGSRAALTLAALALGVFLLFVAAALAFAALTFGILVAATASLGVLVATAASFGVLVTLVAATASFAGAEHVAGAERGHGKRTDAAVGICDPAHRE